MNVKRMKIETLLNKLEAAEFWVKVTVPSDQKKVIQKAFMILEELKRRGVELPSYIKLFHYGLLENKN